MATNKILLKDNNGNILLPITRSVLTELSSTTKQKFTYLDNGVDSTYDNVDDALGYLHDWQGRQDTKLNNLIDAINEELPGAFTASNIEFSYAGHTTNSLDPLYYDPNNDSTKTENVQEAIDKISARVATILDDVDDMVGYTGVSSATGSGVITVTGTETLDGGAQRGALTIGLNVDGSSLVVDPNTSYLKVGSVTSDQVNVAMGDGDEPGYQTLSYVIEDINSRLEATPTDQNLQALTGRVTTLESRTDTLEDQVATIGLVKETTYSGDWAAVYTFTSYDGTTTEINIPKDQFLQSVEYVAADPDGLDTVNYPALVFNWVLDNEPGTDSPLSSFTRIPVRNLVEGAEMKADQALTYIGVTMVDNNGNEVIQVPNSASSAITNKETVEEQIVGLDSELQTVKGDLETLSDTALYNAYLNNKGANVVDNVAYLELDARGLEIGYVTNYESSPGDISYTDTVAEAISKLKYETANIDSKIKLDYIDGGSTNVEPITDGFAGMVIS